MIRTKKAFTLVELMVSLFVFLIILVAVYSAFVISNKFFQTDSAALKSHQQARQAMNWLVKDLHEASSGNISLSYTSPGVDKITFDTPSESGVQYYVNSEQLIREYPTGTTHIIATNITQVDYIIMANMIKITITATTTSLKRPISIQMIEKIRLRN